MSSRPFLFGGGRDVLIFGISQGSGSPITLKGVRDRISPAGIQLNGATLDPATSYRIVTNSFLADGGDSFTVFTQGMNRVGGGEDLGVLTFTEYLDETPPRLARRPDHRHQGLITLSQAQQASAFSATVSARSRR